MNGLFIYEHDLRLTDNNGLNELSRKCDKIYGVYILECRTYSLANKRLTAFINGQLTTLQSHGLIILKTYSSLKKLIKELDIKLVYANKSYAIPDVYKELNVVLTDDYYLQPLGSVLNVNGEIYKKFTPFYKRARLRHVEKPSKLEVKLQKTKIGIKLICEPSDERKIALGILSQLKNYNKPTGLSRYINQGVISIREAYHALNNPIFKKELYWRDHYANLMHVYPHTTTQPFYEKYTKLPWTNNKIEYVNWCNGKTKVPQIDVAMRQLALTGNMPNRLRMVAADYLVKYLFIDWRLGEKHFAKHLIDYDQANNSGNWQWVAGTGCESQPYFRYFNPYTIHPSVAEYIKKYSTKEELVPIDKKEMEKIMVAYRARVKKNILCYKKLG